MDLMLNDLLQLTDDEIANSRIELNMTAGAGEERFVDRWLKSEDSAKESGLTECSYWPWYSEKKGQRNFQIGQTVFSFIQIGYSEWLFISAATITKILPGQCATVSILEKYKGLFGRLVVSYKKGQTYGRYVFRFDKLLPNIKVKEVLSCRYSGDKFEGYDNVNLKYSMLKNIFDGKIMPTYHEALEKITGVYCLTDTSNGMLYIGSATGGGGVWQRWGNYLSSKHGGNVKLRKLHDLEGDAYFEKNFTFTIIEYFGLSYDPDKVKKREQYWKRCFDTIAHGYNDN